MLVPFLGATSVTTTIILAHVVKCRALTVVERGIKFDFARHQLNQPIKHLEQASAKPVIIVEKSDTTKETARDNNSWWHRENTDDGTRGGSR